VRRLRIRGWLLIAGCLAVTAVVYCTLQLRARAYANPQAIASAEDGVYEAVIRDMFIPFHGQARISQLLFDESVLTELRTGEDVKSCQRSAATILRLQTGTPPYNSLADKLYRFLTLSKYDEPFRSRRNSRLY
jgi:hypothetical protein